MPKIVTTFKCKECEDVFEAVSEDFSECKCGKNCVKPNEFSYTYKIDNGRGNFVEILESKTYRFQEEYVELSDEFYALWNNIKEFKDSRQFNCSPTIWIYENKDRSADGKFFMYSLTAEFSDTNDYRESNTVKFYVNLKNKLDKNDVYERLQNFHELLMKVINNEADIHDRD